MWHFTLMAVVLQDIAEHALTNLGTILALRPECMKLYLDFDYLVFVNMSNENLRLFEQYQQMFTFKIRWQTKKSEVVWAVVVKIWGM